MGGDVGWSLADLSAACSGLGWIISQAFKDKDSAISVHHFRMVNYLHKEDPV